MEFKQENNEVVIDEEKLRKLQYRVYVLERDNYKTKKLKVTNFKEIPGKGISFKINEDNIKIGSPIFCDNVENDNYIYVNINNKNMQRRNAWKSQNTDAVKGRR